MAPIASAEDLGKENATTPRVEGAQNGAGRTTGDGSPDPRSRSGEDGPPPVIFELAEGCVRFVERALSVKLDYQPETLSVLDHYLETARRDASQQPAALAIVAHAAGAYLGEVVRRRYASWWRAEGADPNYFRVELEEVFLAISPMQLVAEALVREERDVDDPDEGPATGIEIDEDDREAVKARLADLPPVSEEEYYAPSTRLEVIDITVEAIRAHRMASGAPTAHLTPRDYDSD
jgi:hypothetical protein